MDADFVAIDEIDTIGLDFADGCLHDLQAGLRNPPLPPTMMDHLFPEISLSHIGAPSSSTDMLIENDANWRLRFPWLHTNRPSHFAESDQSIGNTSQQSYGSPSTLKESVAQEVELDPLAPPPKKKRLPLIKPKPDPSPPDVVRGGDNNILTNKNPKKTGIRRGSLPAKTRERASRVRKVRACARCRLRKTPVS